MKLLREKSLKIFFASAIFILFVGAVSAQDNEKWTSYIEFSAKPGSDRSIAKGDLFLPLLQNEDFLLFGNLKANFDDHSYKEGNAGIGARRLYDEWIVGGWVFYDWKESTTGNTFDQMTVGGEFLSNDWDIRANTYIAENKTKDSDRASVVELNGNQIQARLGEERALSGVDFEVGKKLPFLEDSRFFVGGYHYDESGYEKVSGPKLRLEMRFNDLPLLSSVSKGSRLTLGAEYTEDSVRGSETFGLVQLRIPFGGSSNNKKIKLSSLDKRMMETVKRDDDIITNERQGDTLMPLVNPKTGQTISTVETIDASTTNVANTVATAGQNSLIIADGSQGNINIGGSTINVSPGQIIVGGGQQITLQAQKPNGSLLDMVYTPTGQRGSVSRTGSGDLIYVNNDDDVTISGLDLAGGRPIRINNSQNVDVDNTNVQSSASNRQGIYVHNNSSVNFKNVDVSNAGREGILINSGSIVDLQNVDISFTGREAMRILSGSNVTASNIDITKSASEAVELNNSTLSLSNASIRNIDVNANRDGIYATNNSTLNVNNVFIDNVTSQGIISNNSELTILNTAIRNTGHQGIYAYNGSDIELDNVSVSNAGRQGVYTRDAMLDVDNLNINTSANQGIYMLRTVANLDNVTISNSNQQGLYVNRGSANFTNLNIQNSGREGVTAANTAFFNGSNLIVNNSSNRGVYLNNTTSVLNNVTIDTTASQGMLVSNTILTVDNLDIRDAGTQGLYVYNGSTANITNLDITDAGRQGIYTRGSTFNATDVDVVNANNQGAYLYNTASIINDIRIIGAGQQGIYLNRNTNATINNAVIQDSGREGLYARDSDLVLTYASISDITASANRDGIFVYRDSNVTLNSVDVSNVTGDGLQVQGTTTLTPIVVANNVSISNAGRYGIINTRGNLTLNNASVSNSVIDGILANRGDLVINEASVANSGRFGVYVLRSSAAMQNLSVSNTARDGVLLNLSTASFDDSTIRDIGDGDSSDDAIQVTNSTVSGIGNRIEGVINSGVACRSTGTNTGSIGFDVGPIASCP